jgi:hypothetical protein
VDRILTGHLPQLGQGVPTGGFPPQVFVPRERQPAERLQVPALFLLVSGVMQFVFSGFIGFSVARYLMLHQHAPQRPGTSEPGSLLVLLLLAVSALLGLVVIGGALSMRKLRNYRLCLMSSVLAMLPLGFGFVFGLPFGAWGLLVLSRADVKAAFADNDRRP